MCVIFKYNRMVCFTAKCKILSIVSISCTCVLILLFIQMSLIQHRMLDFFACIKESSMQKNLCKNTLLNCPFFGTKAKQKTLRKAADH